MVAKTTVADGRPAKEMARNIGDLTGDIATLVELQAKLLMCDVREASRGMVLPAGLTLVGVALLLGGIPILLVALAYAFIEFAGFTFTGAFVLSAVIGIVLGGLALWAASVRVKRKLHVIERSRNELNENMQAVKRMLRQRGRIHVETTHPDTSEPVGAAHTTRTSSPHVVRE